MFGEHDGFDVVIGNPPWISNDNLSVQDKTIYKNTYKVAKSRFDVANLFVEKAIKFLHEKGLLFFVMPEHIWLGEYFMPFREFLANTTRILEILSLKEGSFEQVKNPSSIFHVQKIQPDSTEQEIELGTFYKGDKPKKFLIKIDIIRRVIFDEFTQKLIKKIKKFDYESLDNIAFVTDGIQTANLLKVIFTKKPDEKNQYSKALRSGKAIKFRYAPIEWEGWWVLKPEQTRIYKRPGFSYDSPKRKMCFNAKEKIILRQTEPSIFATLDTDKYFFPNSIFQIVIEKENPIKLRWLLGLLNSKFLRFLYTKLSQVEGTTKPQIYINLLKNLPVPRKSDTTISNLVDKILSAKAKNPDADTSKLEAEIDQLVYQLYHLTADEINLIENHE